jgi:hypothetical protein
MRIEMKKIRRHKLFPFMVKDVEFEITHNGRKYEQPMSNGWAMVVNADDKEMDVDSEFYAQPFKREWNKIRKLFKKGE